MGIERDGKGGMLRFARLTVVIQWTEDVGVVKFIVMRFLAYGNSPSSSFAFRCNLFKTSQQQKYPRTESRRKSGVKSGSGVKINFPRVRLGDLLD